MEIKAGCVLDYDSYRALTHVQMYKRSKPSKHPLVRVSIYAGLALIVLLIMIAFGADSTGRWCLAACVLGGLLEGFIYFLLPKIGYRAMAKLRGAENGYLFTDETLTITSKSPEYNGETTVEYDILIKAFETTRYFFIFLTKNQAFIVDKRTVDDAGALAIRGKLSAVLGKKYAVCRY